MHLRLIPKPLAEVLTGPGFPTGYERRLRKIYLVLAPVAASVTGATVFFEWNENAITSRLDLLQTIVLAGAALALWKLRRHTLPVLRLALHTIFVTEVGGLLAAYLLHAPSAGYSASEIHIEKALGACTVLLMCAHTIHGPRNAWHVALMMWLSATIGVAAGVVYLASVNALDSTLVSQSVRFVLGTGVALGVTRIVADLYNFQFRTEARYRLLESKVYADPLTGLGNRRWFQFAIEKEHALAHAEHEPLSLILLDIDFFKRINDQHGHGMGDELLREMSEVLQMCVRSRDYVARWGGDEFAVILPATGLKEAIAVAKRILQALRERPFRVDRVSVSAGVAEVKAGEDLAKFVARADQALYKAKRAGKDQVHSECDGGDPGSRAENLAADGRATCKTPRNKGTRLGFVGLTAPLGNRVRGPRSILDS